MASKIIVEGFKSIGERVEVEIRPLTLLAGANSSGKSSLMQSVLLLKQTLESPFDPGPLLLTGPNVKFTAFDQILHSGIGTHRDDSFAVGIEHSDGAYFETRIGRSHPQKQLQIISSSIGSTRPSAVELRPEMTPADLQKLRPKLGKSGTVRSERFMLRLDRVFSGLGKDFRIAVLTPDLTMIQKLIHIPGLRGNPERSYPLSATGPRFAGTFERYTASVIARWRGREAPKLHRLGKNLQQLGLTWKVEARKVDDANVELRVGRMPRAVRGGARDMVNIADVGFGVSQTLPVVVALIEAQPGQVIFVEQPEIHLHPHAQIAMAGLLADAAKRGVILVVETHSSLLLLAVQTLVAEGRLDSSFVKLHWFTRDDKSGATKITSADLDEAGRFGDWPEDFDDVSLTAQSHYLDAVEAAVAKE
jgi:energy-coupling factor transporter ATP-binding protein EcfA2